MNDANFLNYHVEFSFALALWFVSCDVTVDITHFIGKICYVKLKPTINLCKAYYKTK